MNNSSVFKNFWKYLSHPWFCLSNYWHMEMLTIVLFICSIFSSRLMYFVTSLAFFTLYLFCCFLPTLRPTKMLDYYCGDVAQMVQILGSAHGWKACREGWDEKVLLSGDRAFAKPLHGSVFLHLAFCSPSPFPQFWGEQDRKPSLLGCVFPHLDGLPFFTYASTMCNVLPTLQQGNFISSDEKNLLTSGEGMGIVFLYILLSDACE